MTPGPHSLVWPDDLVFHARRRLGSVLDTADPPDLDELRRLRDRLFADRDSAALELLGDRLTEWLHRTEALRRRPDDVREFVTLTESAYLQAGIGGDEVISRVGAKVMSLGILSAKLGEGPVKLFGAADDLTEAMADSVVDALVPLLAESALLRRPDGSTMLHLGLVIPPMLELVDAALVRNTHLAWAVADWVTRQFDRPGLPEPPPVLVALAEDLVEQCEDRMAEVEDRLGVLPSQHSPNERTSIGPPSTDEAALDAAEEAAYRTMYTLHDPEEAGRHARRCLELGDQLLTGPDDNSDQRLSLLVRLFKVSRLTCDVRTVLEQSGRLQRFVRSRGLRFEHAEQWDEAANCYANLGYRYFAAAEYAGVSRMYQLAIYFFDKADVLRHRADVEAMDAHRPFESEGFVYGASARVAPSDTAVELYEQAASAHARAARMTFESGHGPDRLYDAASRFFNAQAYLTRCVHATDFPTCLNLLGRAAENLRPDVTQDVIPLYGATATRLARGESDPCSPTMVQGLKCTLHPDAAGLSATARTAADALAGGDLPAFRDAVQQLSRRFVFLSALG